MNKQQAQKYGKKIAAVVVLPLLVYLIMLIISAANGKSFNIFSGNTFTNILEKTAYMALVALGIGFQLKYGRFDFSGGAIIVVTAIIGAKFASVGANLFVTFIICVAFGMLLSLINSLIYVSFRVPISVISLAAAYLFESFSGLIVGTDAVPQLAFDPAYNKIGMFPLILIPLFLGITAYVVYSHFTVAGKQSRLLRENQKAAVNIGINEKKNTFICYAVSGFIFGLAGMLYAVQNTLAKVSTPLETAGTLFSNIVPSLVGLFLSRYIDDSLGTFVGALTITVLYYGLDVVGVGSGMKTVWYSLFLAIFIFVSGFWTQIMMYLQKWLNIIKGKIKKDSGINASTN